MQQALTQPNWQQPDFTHWLKHSFLPLLLVLMFLLLPKPWNSENISISPILEVELKQTIKQPTAKPKAVESIKPKPSKSKVETGVAGGSPAKPSPAIKTPLKPEPQPIQDEPTQPNSNKPITKPTTSDIMLSARNRVSMDIPTEFQARTGPSKDFYIPEQEIEDWLADIPFLDESVDRPTVQMKFYAEGFTGHIEKFFDKITISKTFTTKYGTKIHCALIGVIAACGWK